MPLISKTPLHEQFGFKVISGGQTGVDVAALRIAQVAGIRTGGLAPVGWKTTAGPKPALGTTFKLTQSHGGYSVRTKQNIFDSDATFVLAHDMESSGTKLTIIGAEQATKPLHKLQLPKPGNTVNFNNKDLDDSVEFILDEAQRAKGQFILNVAGNSSRSVEGIGGVAMFALMEIFCRAEAKLGATSTYLWDFKQKVMQQPMILNSLADNYDYIYELDPNGSKGLIV